MFFRIPQIEVAIVAIGSVPPTRVEEIEEEKIFMKKVMQYLLATYINKMRHTECEGCIRNYPSQRDHSCMMGETYSHIEKYFDSVLSNISHDFVAAVFGFHGKFLPAMDWKAYKASHSSDLHNSLADLVNPVFDDVEFGSFTIFIMK